MHVMQPFEERVIRTKDVKTYRCSGGIVSIESSERLQFRMLKSNCSTIVHVCLVYYENKSTSYLFTQSFNLLSTVSLHGVKMIHGIVHFNVLAAGMSDSVAACQTVKRHSRFA